MESGRMIAEIDPELVLRGQEPRLIDEWQDVPNLWDVARMNIDFNARKGMYIFTGSSLPRQESTSHTGTGRFASVMMRRCRSLNPATATVLFRFPVFLMEMLSCHHYLR
jgi:hypothetical protein